MSNGPRIILVSGVAGAGKSAVGAALARRLGWAFVEGDDHHPAGNIARMARGIPLDEQERVPWLASLRETIERHLELQEPAVIAVSALREAHRRQLMADDPRVLVVFLHATADVARNRLATRKDHFFKADLVDSQFEVLELPVNALLLPADLPVGELVDRILSHT